MEVIFLFSDKKYLIKTKKGYKMRPLKEKVSLTLDNDIVKRLKEEAEKDDRTFSQYINLILKEHVRKLDTKNITAINGNVNGGNIKINIKN